MNKIIDVSEVEKLPRYKQDKFLVRYDDLRALIDKAPGVSSEAVAWCIDDGLTKKILDRTPSEEDIAHAKMFNWLVYPLYTTPQPDRVAELEATNKKLLDALKEMQTVVKSKIDHALLVKKDVVEADKYHQMWDRNQQAIAEAEGK